MHSNLSFEQLSTGSQKRQQLRIPLGLVGLKCDVRREQERVKSLVLGKAGEINIILKVRWVENPTAERI